MATARQPTTVQRDQHWYRLKVGAPVHQYVVPYAKALLERESSFHARNAAQFRAYRGVYLKQHKQAVAWLEAAGRGIATLNATKAICDTFSSRLSKDRPMPGFVVDDSDWDLKRKAQRYREFITGQMLETEFDSLSRRALHDGTRIGSGFTRIDDAGDAVIAERIPVNDLLHDRRECKYGQPRQAIRLHRVARDYLAEIYPDHADWIMHAAPCATRRIDDDDSDSGPIAGDLEDYVDTYTAIYLPMSPDSEAGRRVVCVEGATLDAEQWHDPRFPWAHFQLTDPDEGMHPDGFVAQLLPLQHRVNLTVRDLQLNLTATGRGFFLVNEANDIPVEQLVGIQPYKMKFRGSQPPTWVAPQSINPSQLQMLDRFIEAMFDLTGVSRASAESKSALGAGASGVALDTQYDIDSDRFRMPQANYAKYRLDAAQRYLDAAARVARRRADGKGKKRSWVATTWVSRDAIAKLDYDQVALEEGSYRLRIEPVGFLPDTRAGKLSVVEQLAKAGVIPQWMVPALFDEPDLEEANRILLAPYRNALRKMDLLIDVKQPAPQPEGYNKLDVELEVSEGFYNWVQCEGAPEEIQQRFRDYIDQVKDLIGDATPAPAPQMAPAQQPLPGGVPMMPQGPVPAPEMIGAPPMMPPGGMPMAA